MEKNSGKVYSYGVSRGNDDEMKGKESILRTKRAFTKFIAGIGNVLWGGKSVLLVKHWKVYSYQSE